MSSDQFSYIWSKLPKNAEGKVDYRDFLKIFSTRTDVIRVASTTPPQSRDRRVSSPLSNFYKLVSAEKIPFPTPVEPQRLFQFSSLIYIDKFALIRSGLALILRIKNSILFHLHYQGKLFSMEPAWPVVLFGERAIQWRSGKSAGGNERHSLSHSPGGFAARTRSRP